MSFDDQRPKDPRDRGAYTPPTDDDLPFNRGGFDARRKPAARSAPVTLIVSAIVLIGIVVAVLLLKPWETRGSNEVPPAVGTPVAEMKVPAPLDAQPVDPEAGISVYRDEAEAPATAPTFAPPPETAQPRPAPRPLPPVTSDIPPAAPTSTAPTTVTPATRPTPSPATPPVVIPAARPAASTGSTATGTSAVQIGAFSSTVIADQQFAAIAARYPQFSRGSDKRVQEVPAANGSTVYRTTFTGLSRERAQAFCAAIKSGGGDCLVR